MFPQPHSTPPRNQPRCSLSSAKNVTWKFLAATVPEVGDKWWDLDLATGGGSGAALSAKVLGDQLYAYVDKKTSGDAGCCADTLRIYDKASGAAREIDLDAIMASIFPTSAAFHEATHTFDVAEEGGVVYAWLMTQYTDTSLGNVLANAVVCVNTADGTVRKTLDGDDYFSMVAKIGTTNTSKAASVYKVQYEKSAGGGEQWHGNGMLRFTSVTGARLLAFTHRFDAEAVILSDPWAVAASAGGGAILQRFGTPAYSNGTAADDDEAAPSSLRVVSGEASGYHFFGVPAGIRPWTGGVHNIHYRASSTTAALYGNETLSLFVNSVLGGTKSYVYEFAIAPRPQLAGKEDYDDTVFATPFVYAACGFEAQAMGGARAFGDGVFLVASGVGSGGKMEVVDVSGDIQDLVYPGTGNHNLYDPFTYVTKSAQA